MPASSILIVDDNASLRVVLSIIFSREGYHVRLAEDGFSALEEIERHTPDVLLSDLNMPGMSGFELLSVVRQRFPTIRVVAMSAAFFGEQLPAEVMADAFYAKGTHSLQPLLKLVALLTGSDQPKGRQPAIPSRESCSPCAMPHLASPPSALTYGDDRVI
jgi:CheY-like chemotaxis protein